MNLKESISFFFFGASCIACGRGPAKLDPWLCQDCREELIACGERPIWSNENAICLFPMTPLTRSLILAMKYKGMQKIASYLVAHSSIGRKGEAMQIISSWGNMQRLRFLPVPAHSARMRERGYNQCERAALEISLHCGGNLDTKTLKRITYNPSQTLLGSSARFLNVAGAFKARKAQSDSEMEETLVIVDDVYTTGATTASCARALKRAGFENVKVCALLCEIQASAAADLAADASVGWNA